MANTYIDLKGWAHVHTWYESHGDHIDYVYQQIPEKFLEDNPDWVTLLCITKYRDENRHDRARTEHGKLAHDYLLAQRLNKILESDPDRLVSASDKHITPCCTAGWGDFYDRQKDQYYRMTTVAGHGTWAVRLGDADIKEKGYTNHLA